MSRIYFTIYLLIFITLSSCAEMVRSDVKFSNNDVFEEKYRDEILKINADRNYQERPDLKTYFKPSEQDLSHIDNVNSFDYVGISNFDTEQPKKIFPNFETYELGINRNPNSALSPRIFEISYNTTLNPPFNRNGEEFDFIDIPEKDSYGVKSASNDKNYTLVPLQSIYYAINQINNSRTSEDIEFSKKIILEKKLLLRKKKLQKFQEKSQYAKLFEDSYLKNDKISKN